MYLSVTELAASLMCVNYLIVHSWPWQREQCLSVLRTLRLSPSGSISGAAYLRTSRMNVGQSKIISVDHCDVRQ